MPQEITIPITNAFQNYGYAAIFPILTVGGPLAALSAGFLASQGFFSPFLIWPLAILADLVADIFWYTLGRFGREHIYLSAKKFLDVTEEKIQKAERLFRRRGNKIIFLSKVTMGFGFLSQFMLSLQGFLRIPFRIFIFYNFLGGVILSGAASFCGYYFGLALFNMSPARRTAIFLSFLIAILLAGIILKRIFLTALPRINDKLIAWRPRLNKN